MNNVYEEINDSKSNISFIILQEKLYEKIIQFNNLSKIK